jgi:glycerol uptake facilitator-like aquaporin
MRGGTVVGWREVFSEFAGTALLLLFGLSAIVMDFSQDSPMMSLIPSGDLRRLLTAVIFSLCGTLIIYSPLGRISGGHINPAVTVAFLRLGKISAKSAIAYIVAQVAGAAAGAVIVSFIWGHRVKNSRLMVTVPGPMGTWAALAVETAATFLLIGGVVPGDRGELLCRGHGDGAGRDLVPERGEHAGDLLEGRADSETLGRGGPVPVPATLLALSAQGK